MQIKPDHEMSSERIAVLLNKYLEDDLSIDEHVELEQWKQNPHNQKLFEDLTNPEYILQGLRKMNSYNKVRAFENLQSTLSRKPKTTISIYRRLLAAAILIGLIATGVVMYFTQEKTKPAAVAVTSDPATIQPGGNRAMLTLADGLSVMLDDSPLGLVAQQGNTTIEKQDGGLVVYKGEEGQLQTASINTLQTPRGGQYKLVLQDGSKVTLNADSKLEFPSSFDGADTRVVKLTGEAFFEVAKDRTKPFYVQVRDMDVVVKGTAFNVESYPNDQSHRTTLFEGSVTINSRSANRSGANNTSFDLNPGEQFRYDSLTGTAKVIQSVDLEAIAAWRNGTFFFDNEDLGSVLRDIERWYDIEVRYKNGIPAIKLYGEIDRTKSLSEVIKLLDAYKVATRLEGKILYIL